MEKKVQGWNSECLYANLSLGWHCTEESIRGAGAWAAPWTALSISMGIPRHMRAHRCSWAYASIWALGLATCGYEEYGHKWRKAHPHTNTNSTSLSLSSQIHIIRKKHCVLYVAISVFQPPFYHFYFFTYLKVFDFSLSKCAATSGCQGTDLVDFVLPNCFRTIRCHQQSGADGRSYPPPPTS